MASAASRRFAVSLVRNVATFAIRPAPEALMGVPMGSYSIRDCVSRVANRLKAQEEVPLFDEVPRTLDGATLESDQARIITTLAPPHTICFANSAWERLCGYSAEEVIGRSGLRFLQGPHTDPLALARIREAVSNATRARVEVVNYRKDGTAFVNQLLISPLASKAGDITHMLGVLSEVRPLPHGMLSMPADAGEQS